MGCIWLRRVLKNHALEKQNRADEQLVTRQRRLKNTQENLKKKKDQLLCVLCPAVLIVLVSPAVGFIHKGMVYITVWLRAVMIDLSFRIHSEKRAIKLNI